MTDDLVKRFKLPIPHCGRLGCLEPEQAQKMRDRIEALTARADKAEAAADWRNDPESSEAWCAGNQHALDRLCAVVKADPARVVWDGSDGSLNDETDALIWRILRHDEDDDGRTSAERDAARLRAACAPLGSAMYFMDDSASDEDVRIISVKTVKDIRAALKGEQK